MGEYKCFFCAEGNTPMNAITQLEVMAREHQISKHDIIQLALIEEIRKIRILLEEQQQRVNTKKINTASRDS